MAEYREIDSNIVVLPTLLCIFQDTFGQVINKPHLGIEDGKLEIRRNDYLFMDAVFGDRVGSWGFILKLDGITKAAEMKPYMQIYESLDSPGVPMTLDENAFRRDEFGKYFWLAQTRNANYTARIWDFNMELKHFNDIQRKYFRELEIYGFRYLIYFGGRWPFTYCTREEMDRRIGLAEGESKSKPAIYDRQHTVRRFVII